MDAKEFESLQRRIDFLFAYSEEDGFDHLRTVSDYFVWLSDIVTRKNRTLEERDLMRTFESVYLWLQQRLEAYSKSIASQTKQIVDDRQLCELLPAIADGVGYSPVLEGLGVLARVFYRVLPWASAHLIDDEPAMATGREIKKVRRALARLAQNVKYAASLEQREPDKYVRDFKDHYDPEQRVNRAAIGILISRLRIQVAVLPDTELSTKLLEKIERLETELKSKNVRWTIVISGFFAMLAVVADFKSVAPDTYSAVAETVQQIVVELAGGHQTPPSFERLLPPPTGSTATNRLTDDEAPLSMQRNGDALNDEDADKDAM